MRTLDDEQIRAFLTEGTRTAKLAVVRKDGSPLVTPVWFLVEDDGTIVFTTGKRTVKGRALERDPRVSICVEDDRPPFAFVRVDGVAELSEDPAELQRFLFGACAFSLSSVFREAFAFCLYRHRSILQ